MPRRPLQADDWLRLQTVAAPECSPDGQWVAYTLTHADRDADEQRTELWVVDWQGKAPRRLAAPPGSLSAPAFSPDGRQVSYLGADSPDATPQIMVVDRAGGEARALTHVTGTIAAYAWAPDGRHIVLAMAAGDGATAAAGAHPIVIDRLHFKQDAKGYVTAADRTQIHLLDVSAGTLTALTGDPRFDDSAPAWSPDGSRIAFVSTRDSDPDRTGAQELYVMDARAGAPPRKLASFQAPNVQKLLWLADARRLVYSVGEAPRLNAYMQDRLALATLEDDARAPRVLAPSLDRPVSLPVAGADAHSVRVIVADDGTELPVDIDVDSGRLAPALGGRRRVSAQCQAAGHAVLLAATDETAPELHALEGGQLRRLTAHNDALLAELALGPVRDFSFRGSGGETVHGLLTEPPGPRKAGRLPAVLWIHGGPNEQDAHGLSLDNYSPALERQWLAAAGYVVLGVNYHGSSGRGAQYASSIAGDWGHREVEDLLAAADALVEAGVADPQRLGIGGWSYGGILADYVIASDTRFKAAISGAASGDQLAIYGSDQYIVQYNAELGPPWQHAQDWLRLSYPFLHADRIRTPTLFLGGDRDFNVPIGGGEQMYAALRTLGVPTSLVVYPGQYHEFTRPSFLRDRALRYVQWFDRYLKAPAP